MRKINLLLITSTLIVLNLISCGGGGVSEEFTKEINEFETAWTNSGTSFLGIIDSVKTTVQAMDLNMNLMVVPDSLTEKIQGENSKKLDSVKNVCANQDLACAGILKELEDYKPTWDKETNAFEEWKDKVLKGEIDIETAKKDLVIYKTKMTDAGLKSTDAYNRLSEIKITCAGTCSQFNQMIVKMAAEEPKPKRRNR